MSIFDKHGYWLFGNDGTMDEELQEEEHQEKLCRLMEMYQDYFRTVVAHSYVTRKSVIYCQYGTQYVYLDAIKDYGVFRGSIPVMICHDCKTANIHHFGSCLCPESNYSGRLPMTVSSRPGEKMAIKAKENIFSHICVPLINTDQGWQQVNHDVLIEVGQEGFAPILLDNAFLVCQYGGIIRILEVAEDGNDFDEELLVTMQQMENFGFSITEDELRELNELLEEYGVTERGSIAFFLATCGHESAKGTKLLEEGTEEYFRENGYTSYTRGAGYMMITGEDQLKFYEYFNIAVPENRAEDIASHYAWLSAIWAWAICSRGEGVIMNNYVNFRGDGENIFLITQYFINSYLSKEYYPYFNGDLGDIRDGKAYEMDFEAIWKNYNGDIYTGTLSINDRVYRLPVNYKDRLENYYAAMDCFK